ncbi:MAG TPA: 2-oxoacid:ferredoxin oxidoreductase subunit beta [Dehalococcoidia bacterium]|nr:2-oxoacid:ferredoxin oxidoreductase subunit beta [Dehalococcoidia bacterium]
MSSEIVVTQHPLDGLLRADRLPHIWCPGCGLGSVMACLANAMVDSGIPLERQVVVSGIGCTGRVAGYLNVDSFHTTHGRAIPFATGIKLANPDLEVTVISGDGDLFAIGGNHFLHAARRNIDINVICVNNFNYGMTGGQMGPTTPVGARTTTTPFGNAEPAFNLPGLAASLGAVYVARWTSLHVRQLHRSILRAIEKRGFTFIEALSPCPVGFGKSNDIGEGLDEMWLYRRACTVDPDADLARADIDLRHDSEIVLGNFIDIERPVYRPAGPGA